MGLVGSGNKVDSVRIKLPDWTLRDVEFILKGQHGFGSRKEKSPNMLHF